MLCLAPAGFFKAPNREFHRHRGALCLLCVCQMHNHIFLSLPIHCSVTLVVHFRVVWQQLKEFHIVLVLLRMRTFNLGFIQNYVFKKNNKTKTKPSLFPFENEYLFCKPLLRSFCSIDSCSLLYSVGNNTQKLVSTFFIEFFSMS